MAPRRQTTNYPTLPKLCLGPGDSFVADYEDPRRLLGSNLPSGLKKIIADRLIDKTDSDSESELDVGDTSNNSGNESGSGSDTDTSERSRRRTRERSNSRAREEVIVREDKRYYGDDLYSGRKRRIKEPFRISCLAFGSRVGDFAMISCKNGEYYLDGNVFQRLFSLSRWLVPQIAWGNSVDHAPIKSRNGADIRLFLGAESTYFAVDTRTREYITNIDTADFTDWLMDCVDLTDPRSSKTPVLKREHIPHCLVCGPDDMFCWISQKSFKVNNAFRNAFPSIERFLIFSKAKKTLNKVTFIGSTDAQPGSKLPYYILSTDDGVFVSAVPASASDLISKYSTRWGAVRAAKRAREMQRLTSSEKSTRQQLNSLTKTVNEAWSVVHGEPNDGEPNDGTRILPEPAISVLMNLKLIEDDCRKKSPDVQGWAQKSLADRVHILLGDRTLDGNTLEEWEQLATTLSREIRVAEKTIAGGTKGHVPDDSTSDPEVMDMIKYVVHEVEAINQVCETNKVGRCDWENLSLAGRIAAIAANQATPELQKKINDGVWALNSHYGIPKDFTPVDQMNVIIQGLEIIDKDVNNVPFVNDDWRAIPLADRVNTIVSQRHKFDQESDNPSERLLDLLMTSIYDLRPAKGIRSDPTGIQYAITIISELTSIEQAVNSTVDQSSTGEFGKWRIRNLADRVQSIATDYTSITNRFDAALKRLRVELKALPVGPSRDRAIAILLKVFPEELANAKKEKPEEPEEPWHPTIDPDA